MGRVFYQLGLVPRGATQHRVTFLEYSETKVTSFSPTQQSLLEG